jgi:hypothetical protein
MKLRHVPSRIREWWKNRPGTERLEISFQGVIMLATLAYVSVASFQWCAMRTSNQINREALTSVQRAFVLYKDLVGYSYLDVTKNGQQVFWLHPVWENSGNTPTKDLHIYVSEPKPAQPPYTNLDFSRQSVPVFTPMLIAPHDTVRGSDRQIAVGDLLKLHDAKGVFYVWGWATYRDIFPDTKPHITRFCVILTGALFDADANSITTTKSVRIINEFCPTYNCADEECEQQDRAANK